MGADATDTKLLELAEDPEGAGALDINLGEDTKLLRSAGNWAFLSSALAVSNKFIILDGCGEDGVLGANNGDEFWKED